MLEIIFFCHIDFKLKFRLRKFCPYDFYEDFTPTGLCAWGLFYLLQRFHPYGALFVFSPGAMHTQPTTPSERHLLRNRVLK